MATIKACKFCGKDIVRDDNITDHNWTLKRFCNKTCKHKSHIGSWVSETYEQRRARLQ